MEDILYRHQPHEHMTFDPMALELRLWLHLEPLEAKDGGNAAE